MERTKETVRNVCCGLCNSLALFSQLEHGENTSLRVRVTFPNSGIRFHTFSVSFVLPKSFLLTSAFTWTRISKISSPLKQNTSKYNCLKSWLKVAEWVLQGRSYILYLCYYTLLLLLYQYHKLKYLSHPLRSCSHRDWMKMPPLIWCLSAWCFPTVALETRKSASIG